MLFDKKNLTAKPIIARRIIPSLYRFAWKCETKTHTNTEEIQLMK